MKYLICVLALVLAPFALSAQEYQRSFRDWSVFKHDGSCYIGSAPIRQSGNYANRGQPYVLVVKRGNDMFEVNVSSGYPYKTGEDVIVTIGLKRFELFTQDDTAWAYDEMKDRAMIDAMKAGNEMQVKGQSQKGTHSADSYSLIGFTAAFNFLKGQCK